MKIYLEFSFKDINTHCSPVPKDRKCFKINYEIFENLAT